MDAYDEQILRLVQDNNRLTNGEIGKAVHLSETAVRRRLRRLREEGVIVADVSIVASRFEQITVIVEVAFKEESSASYADFKRQMLASPQVTQCYSVSGDIDFIVVAHAPTLEDYEAWGHAELLSNPAIARYSTHVVWSTVKKRHTVPLKA